MLNRFRAQLKGIQEALGRGASRAIPNPSAWTAFGFALAIAAGLAYARGVQPLAGLLLLASGSMDVVDGAVARAMGSVSVAGAFLDSSLDRAAEVAVYLGIIVGAAASSYMAASALAASMMVSYLRARMESLSRERPRGVEVGERAERLLALAAFSLAGLAWIGVVIVLAIALETAVERFAIYMRALSRSSA